MKCLNCDTEFEGNFCPECGQSAKTGRFTMKFILQNLTTAILGRDGGVWFTLKNLFSRPGAMIVEILSGKRKKYFSPFPMLFFALTLYILVTSATTGFMLQEAFSQSDTVFTEESEEIDSQSIEVYHLLKNTVFFFINHYTLCFLLTLPLFVIAARACYGRDNRKKYYWAEYIITIVYALVIVVLFRCLTKLTYLFDHDLALSLGFTLAPLVMIVACTACSRRMLGFSIAKTAWRSFLLVLLYSLMLFGLLLIGAILFALIVLNGKGDINIQLG